MPRPQFSIRTLLWLTLVFAAFLGGMQFEHSQERMRLDREFWLSEINKIGASHRPKPDPRPFMKDWPVPK